MLPSVFGRVFGRRLACTGGPCSARVTPGGQVTRHEMEILFAEEFGDLPLRCRHRGCTSCSVITRFKASRQKRAQTAKLQPN